MQRPPFDIQQLPTPDLTPGLRAEVIQLCEAAYGEPIAPYLDAIGPGQHLLGQVHGRLASHLMWVDRWLQPQDGPFLRTAYVELVATVPGLQGRGYATRLLEALVHRIRGYQLAALSPATEGLYLRLGWRYWQGPLATRTTDGLQPDPAERVMILPLPRTPTLDPASQLTVEWRPGEVW